MLYRTKSVAFFIHNAVWNNATLNHLMFASTNASYKSVINPCICIHLDSCKLHSNDNNLYFVILYNDEIST